MPGSRRQYAFFAIHRGTKIKLPTDDSQLTDYFKQIVPLENNPVHIQRIIDQLENLEPEVAPLKEAS